MEEVKQLAARNDPLLACSLCRKLMQDPVQLTCLHSCCRHCFSQAVSHGNSRVVACAVCGATTGEGAERTNSFIEKELQHCITIIETRSCGVCKRNGELEKPACMWCPDCGHSLCGDCIAPHGHYYRQHTTLSLEELTSLEEVCPKPSASTCLAHNKPLEIACLTCEQAKCTLCWADCKKDKHDFHIVGDDGFEQYVGEIISRVSFMESELLRKSAVLERPKTIAKNAQASRTRHLKQINERKRRIVDSVELSYQQIEILTKNAYDDLERDAAVVSDAADRIASSLSDARSYIDRLIKSNKKCEILNQQKFVQERLRVLSAEIDTLNETLGTSVRAVKIDSSLPDGIENVVKQWIGLPLLYSAFSFSSALASFQLPVECYDVAMAMDGRLLLAAGEHGLIEFCSKTGRELSRWLPPKHRHDKGEWVQTVAALSNGIAAVGMCKAQLVALLRRSHRGSNDGENASSDAWTEERRLDGLPWRPGHMSAHGDVLAVTDGNRHLLLMTISSGRQLRGDLWREYSIRCLAVAAGVVVTGGSRMVEGNSSRRANVLEAHRVADGDEWLWRHELSSDEVQGGMCADSTGGCLYAVVRTSDRSGGRVSAFGLDNGIELIRTVLKFDPCPQPLLLPERLSVCECERSEQQQQQQQQASSRACSSSSSNSDSSRVLLLAVLCYDKGNKQRKLNVHRSA